MCTALRLTFTQQASCTLDAGVKIYASRVDSVHSETFKVLGGLSRSAAPRADALDEDGEEQDAEGDAEGEDGAGEKTVKGKSRRGGGATLEPAEAHTSRALEDAIAVDPLFQKTSAQFDEGGAAGLLMNALSVHRGCDTVFDSNEVPDYAGVAAFRGPAALSSITLDLSALSPALQPAATAFAAAVVPAVLTPTLASIRALLPGGAVDTSTAAIVADASVTAQAEAMQDAWAEGGMFAAAPPGTDSGDTCAPSYEDDLYSGGGNYGGMDDDDDGDSGTAGFGSALGGASLVSELRADAGGVAPAGRFLMADGGVLQWVSAAADAAGAQHRRAWAGASHWRFRSAPMASAADPDAPAAPAPTRKTKKGPFFIDFCAPLPELDAALFAPGKATETRLAGAPTPADTLLPADLRYSSSQLVRLFLKPQMGPASSSGPAQPAEYAYEPNASVDYDDDDAGGADFGGGDVFGGWDEPAANNAASADGSLVLAPRRVEQIRVNYSRSAKVVDVRALKTTLWDGLERSSTKQSAAGSVSFASLLESVTPECGAGALEDVSVHMCFICVLHLANEHGLAIKGVPSLDVLHVSR